MINQAELVYIERYLVRTQMWGLFFVFVVYLILHLSMLPRSNALRLQKPIQQSRGSLHLSDKRTGDQRDKSKRKNRLKKEGMDNTMEDKVIRKFIVSLRIMTRH